ncbi:MAG TPA: insulinase family protein [Usitatibacter sp.]|jgi:zinc protease|nr:insulinase family protein [Usitatibacter sp.]
MKSIRAARIVRLSVIAFIAVALLPATVNAQEPSRTAQQSTTAPDRKSQSQPAGQPASTATPVPPTPGETPPTSPPGTSPSQPPQSTPKAPPKGTPPAKPQEAPQSGAAQPEPSPGAGSFQPGARVITPTSNVKRTPIPNAPKLGNAIPVSVIRKVHVVEGITEYRLPNGLKVLLFPDGAKPTVTVNVTYLVGSRFENYGETGMAHLLEHLMFKGTPSHPHIDQEFNKRGVRYNGSTWLDRTNYFEIFQANPGNVDWAIGLEADRMVNSYIARSDLDTEMTVVRNEYESGENSPFSVMMKRMQSVAFDWHAYGRATIGARSDIENVDIPHLQHFYQLYYQPDNAVLLIAGKFDPKRALEQIAKTFGRIPKPTRTLPKLWTVEPTQDGDREFTVRRKGDIQIVGAAYKVPSNIHNDSDPLAFANLILGAVPTGRLQKALVDTGLAAQVFGYPLMGHDPGLQIFGAVVPPGKPVKPVRDELIKVVESFGDTPPTQAEMERTRTQLANEIEKTLDDPESLGVQLSEYISLGDWRLFFLARDDLDKITAAEVARVSKAYFRRDDRTVGYFLPTDDPQRAEIPANPPLEEVMKDFHPKAEAMTGEAFDPSQDNIDQRTKIIQVGNVKVALLRKKNRGEAVNFTVSLHLGNEQALFGQRQNYSNAARMLMRGTTKYTRSQLSDEFDRLKIAGRVGGPGGSFQTTGANLPAAIRLVAHVLREPAFPANEFEQLKTQAITSITAQLSEPTALAADVINDHFNIYPQGDWRYVPSLHEALDEVKASKLEDAKRFHDRFYGAAPAEIAIVGDFDEAAATEAIKQAFADWKPQVPFKRVEMEYQDVAPIEKSIETPDKENAVFLARQNVEMRDDDPDYPALYLADYIVGGGAGFDSRLTARIRQKEGLSYGVGSDLSVGSLDRAGSWTAYAITAPQNMAKVEAAFRDEMQLALRGGFTDAEVQGAKSGILQQRAQNRAQDGTLAGAWAANLYLGRTFEFSKDFERKLLAVKTADVNAALRKYIDPAKLTIVKAGDFAKKR